MKIGIVILNYNDAENTLNLVNQIREFKTINDIVIVDNNSTDNSLTLLKNNIYDEKIHIIKSNKNGGYAYGNNFGIKFLLEKGICNYIFIANPDVSFTEEFVINIIQQFQKNPEYAILSGVMLDKNNEVYEKPYWRSPTYIEDIKDCMIIFRMWIKKSKHYLIDYSKPIMEVDVVSGSLFAFNIRVMKEIGYFDENTFLYYEENILSKKVHQKGYKEGIITNITFNHMHGETVRKNLKVLNNHKIHLESKYYYETTYNKINFPQKVLLKFMMSYSMLETAIITPMKRLFK